MLKKYANSGFETIGGLLTSLFLTLVVVPAVYDLLDDLQGKFMKKKISNSRSSVG